MEEIICIVKAIVLVFGGVNLEDIVVFWCFEIEVWLKKELNIFVFYDDQYGIVIVILVVLLNVFKFVGKVMVVVCIVINGVGVVGLAIVELFKEFGVIDIWICDFKGIVGKYCIDLNSKKQSFVVDVEGILVDVMVGVDVFLGVSVLGVVIKEMV